MRQDSHVTLQDTITTFNEIQAHNLDSLFNTYLKDRVITAPTNSMVYFTQILSLPLVSRSIGYLDDPMKIGIAPITELSAPRFEPIRMPKTDNMLAQENLLYTLQKIQAEHPEVISYGKDFLEAFQPDYKPIGYKSDNLNIVNIKSQYKKIHKNISTLEELPPQIKHWFPAYEGSLQFSQNYISDNWYKGGSSNLNLFIRNYFSLIYLTERVNWFNELESRLNLYNTSTDIKRRFRVGDDLLRFHSNYGNKIFKRWYWTIDWEVRTQMLPGIDQNDESLLSSFLSPITSTVGLGMKYEYTNTKQKALGKRIRLMINIAPISHSFKYALNTKINLDRHGLSLEKPYISSLGGTVSGDLLWDFNYTIGWRSRLNLNVGYNSNVFSEWENTLNFNFNKFLSTKLYLHLRYDNSVPSSQSWMKYLQVNELISIGINYRLNHYER